MKPTICICGGGALGHTIAGFIAAKDIMNVNILTSSPKQWAKTITIHDCQNKTFKGKLQLVTDKAEEAIPTSDIILLCLPGFLIPHKLENIKPYVTSKQCIGSVVSSTGFFFMAKDILPEHTKLFGFQRVPFISRVEKYGHSASLLGYKKQLKLGTINIDENHKLPSLLEQALACPIKRLSHYLDAALSNSNPILHTTRLFNLFHDYKTDTKYDHKILFYEEWNDDTSELLIQCDNEFQQIISHLPVDKNEQPPLMQYYESSDIHSLTNKIRSISAFKGLKAPMIQLKQGNCFIPDLQSRYFTEDFPYGLLILKLIANQLIIDTPYIDKVLTWGKDLLGNDVFDNSYFKLTQKIKL